MTLQPKEILEKAYEYAVRQDIVHEMGEAELSEAQCEALLKQDKPVAGIFADFKARDTSYMDIVLSTMEGRANAILREEFKRAHSEKEQEVKNTAGSVRAQFEQKVKDCFEAYKAEWLQKRPDALIEDASEIAAIQLMARELPSQVSDEDAEYLLRFKNPLEVVADQWQEENGPETVIDDEMTHVLWNIRDKQSAESVYEMELEYAGSAPELTM